MASERLLLSRVTNIADGLPPPETCVQVLSKSDIPALARLMIDAYRGEADDEGETEAEP
jgi:hypothetical protein